MKDFSRSYRRWRVVWRASLLIMLLAAAAMAVSLWSPWSAARGRAGVVLKGGQLGLVWSNHRLAAHAPGSWQLGSALISMGPRSDWLPSRTQGGIMITGPAPIVMNISGYYLPLWWPLVLGPILAAAARWRMALAVQPGSCRQCHYDLTGIAASKCPECGCAC